jgi:hypothetical protein
VSYSEACRAAPAASANELGKGAPVPGTESISMNANDVVGSAPA